MPVALDRSDRKLLLITGFVLLGLVISLVSLAPGSEEGNEPPFPSSYLAGPSDALAAYELLERLHFDIQRWNRPPNELPSDCDNCVLILADPMGAPAPEEKQALLTFVQGGGRVLFTGRDLFSFFDANSAALEPQPLDARVQEYAANLPSIFSRDAPRITLRPEALWAQSQSPAIPLYGELDSPAVVVRPVGSGRILWWAGATPLTNSAIRSNQNMNLFLDSATSPSSDSGEPPRIFWDEYYHGERNSLWAYVAETPLPWGILQLAVLGLVVFFTLGRRSGPIFLPAKTSRLAPLEFVDTLGGLYERARASAAAVAVVYQQFRGALIRQLRLPADVPDHVLGAEAQQRIGFGAVGPSFGQGGLAELLRRAAAATRDPTLNPRVALDLVRELEQTQQRLGLKSYFAEQRG
ncbi:MAG: DUF4350 domain-containing protein [Candidatus Acidiferrales bacterium]